MEAADGQGIRVEARVTPDKPHEMEYHGFGVEKQLTVNDMKVSVSFIVDGKEAWTWSTIQGAPMFLQIKKGDSLDQVIAAEQGKAWQALGSVELPKMLPAPRDVPEFGTSPLIPGTGKK
jgi:hypothetical protein